MERIFKRFNHIFLHLANHDYYREKYDLGEIDSFDFEKSGDSKEVDNLMNAFLQSEETKKNNNKHNNAEKVSHLKKVVKSKD